MTAFVESGWSLTSTRVGLACPHYRHYERRLSVLKGIFRPTAGGPVMATIPC